MNIKLSDSDKIKVLNSHDLYSIMQRILLREDKIDQDREHLWVIGLANNNKILFIEHVSKGTVNRTLVDPMEVFSFALQKRAVKIILVHNHPSGELTPSEADKDITDKLIQVGIIVTTELLDHLIITTESYVSFADMGLMAELEKSVKYVPQYKLEQRIKAKANELNKQKSRKQMLNVAKGFKEDGLDIKQIAKHTGLSVEEIEKIKIPKK